jgi:uncharacterized protein (DUF433 family)
MQVSTEHLEIDDRGNPRIAGTRIKVRHLAMLIQNGHTPEQIQQEIPHVSLAQIHAGLAYYYDHRLAIDEELKQAEEFSESLRNNPEQIAFAARIRERAAKRQ